MLRITPSLSAEAAVAYLLEQFMGGDYYAEGGETVGRWFGKGAEKLGLIGDVEGDDYRHLCYNRTPDGKDQLTPITREGRRVGYDFTFSVPKSVSLGYLLDRDERIMDAFQAAFRETMADVEADMKTRVRIGGANEDRVTGNILAAEFIHLTARPIDGVPDPQLHAHVFVHNATWDEIEKRMKAGQFGDIKADARYYESLFHSRLAMGMAKIGYVTERSGDYWEVGGVSREMIGAFSRRTAHIEEVAGKLGITDAAEKADLGRRTRESKEHALPRDQVDAVWKDTAERVGYRGLEQGGVRSTITAEAAIDYALEKGFAMASVLRDRDVLEDAMRRSFGCVDHRAIRQAFDARPDLIRREADGDHLVTTHAVLAEEKRFLDQARAGLNTREPIKPGQHQFKDQRLDKDQRGAVEHVLNSPDWITLIRGVAGTGKTTLMTEAIPAIESKGHKVTVLAPSVPASRDQLRKEGFKEADTLAQFLLNPVMQHKAKGQVIWVDEIGQVGAADMRRLFDLAKELDARIVGCGDSRQHAPVPRGDALRLLQENGIVPFTVATIKRQQPPDYRRVVELLAEGRTLEGFDRMVKMGWVKELADDGERLNAIVADYLKARDTNKIPVLVAPTHAEGRAVTRTLRDRMFERRELRGEERTVQRLQRQEWTLPERKDAQRYEPGMVVQFQRNTVGFKAGERVTVKGIDRSGNVEVERASGKAAPLDLKAAASFAVFQPETLQLAAGDQIRITGKGMTLDARTPARRGWRRTKFRDSEPDRRVAINNGRMLTVAGFTNEGHIITSNGWTLGKDFGHLSHGYAVTSQASQGKTGDVVLGTMPAATFKAASQEQFYVTVSRGRESATIYTDDVARLRQEIQRSSTRMSATELERLPIAISRHLDQQRRQEEANYAAAHLTRRLVQRGIEAHRNPPRIMERGRGR